MVIQGRIAGAISIAIALAMPILSFAQSKKNLESMPEVVPGQFLVRVKDSLLLSKAQAVKALEEATRGHVLRQYEDQGFVVLQKPVIQNQISSLREIHSSGMVELAEPNYIYRMSKVGNDPQLGQLWGLRNQGQQDSGKQNGVVGIDIDAERAWDINTGSRKVLVAVIDTGIDYNHPDLAPNAWINQAEANGVPGVDDDGNGIIDDIHGANFVNPQAPTGNPLDDQGHGSHCSGTIGAKGNDGVGIVGVAWDVQIMGVKFLGSDGSGTLEGAILAIDYATRMGAKILSNSWAGGSYSKLLEEAIQRADQGGALFVAASSNSAGNNDIQPVYPATYNVPNIISVAAIDNRGSLADFSNYGRSSVHVAAPGVNVFSSVQGGKYDSWSGTSMATPHVSGIAALVLSANEGMTHHEIKDRIIAGARPLAGLRGKVFTGGVANAYYAMTGVQPPQDPNDPSKWAHTSVSFSSPHPYSKNERLEFEVSVPGAKEMSLYFPVFQTERGYDILTLLDRNGNVLGRVHGNMDDIYSPIIAGDYVKLVFTSDDSIHGHGFDLTQVAYR